MPFGSRSEPRMPSRRFRSCRLGALMRPLSLRPPTQSSSETGSAGRQGARAVAPLARAYIFTPLGARSSSNPNKPSAPWQRGMGDPPACVRRVEQHDVCNAGGNSTAASHVSSQSAAFANRSTAFRGSRPPAARGIQRHGGDTATRVRAL
jgi:hypothetical protein